jgi:hypothetical protein
MVRALAFDFVEFFRRHRIEYATSGPSVTKNNVAIHCPFCGGADHSQHMGVSLLGKGWRCWRNPAEHKGRHPFRLVKALLGCSTTEAMRITGTSHVPVSADLLERVKQLMEGDVIESEAEALEPPVMPSTFRHLNDGLPASFPYRTYLEARGYTDEDLPWLDWLGLRYATRGAWKGRILFPVRVYGKLVSWTGRTIWPSEELRYRTLSVDWEKAKYGGDRPALTPINHSLLWHDSLLDADADTFVAVEGPFDALRVVQVAGDDGVFATCLFGSSPTDEQVNLLYDILPRFKHRYLLLDGDMMAASLRVADQLSATGLVPRFLPEDLKDPGDVKLTRDRLWDVLEKN